MRDPSIRPFEFGEDWEAIATWLTESPQQLCPPSAHFVAKGPLSRLSLRRAQRTLATGQSIVATEFTNRISGLACWSNLTWDSQQLGVPAARVDVLWATTGSCSELDTKQRLVAHIVDDARQRGVRHLIARVDATSLTSVHALEGSGFELLDAIQTFSVHLHTTVPCEGLNNMFHTRLCRDEDIAQILAIARLSYSHDRFHADSAIDDSVADRMNEDWLRNSCSLKFADAVIVVVADDAVLGYVTCKVDHETRDALGVCFGSIGMVATREDARRRGVAQSCTFAALQWFQRNHVHIVEVGTQLRNIPAARLYEKSGFRMCASSFTLRKTF